jgi:hypothetical protein
MGSTLPIRILILIMLVLVGQRRPHLQQREDVFPGFLPR